MLGTTSGLWVPHYYARNQHFTQPFELQVVTGLILPVVVNEFKFKGPFLKLGQNIYLLIGGAFWAMGSRGGYLGTRVRIRSIFIQMVLRLTY
jgi:hypothetical protein